MSSPSPSKGLHDHSTSISVVVRCKGVVNRRIQDGFRTKTVDPKSIADGSSSDFLRNGRKTDRSRGSTVHFRRKAFRSPAFHDGNRPEFVRSGPKNVGDRSIADGFGAPIVASSAKHDALRSINDGIASITDVSTSDRAFWLRERRPRRPAERLTPGGARRARRASRRGPPRVSPDRSRRARVPGSRWRSGTPAPVQTGQPRGCPPTC